MSRIGMKAITLGSGVKVELEQKNIKVSGKKGTLEHAIPDLIDVVVAVDKITVTRVDESRPAKSLHGLTRTLIANMVTGVDTGFKKDLLIQGVGYRAQVKGKTLALNLGYSHPVDYPIPDDVEISVAENVKITVEGSDKQRVGQVAATIRGFRKPEPYKGKGIRYQGEHIALKEGKKV